MIRKLIIWVAAIVAGFIVLVVALAFIMPTEPAISPERKAEIERRVKERAEARAKDEAQARDATAKRCESLPQKVRYRDIACLRLACPALPAAHYEHASQGEILVGMDGCLVKAFMGKPEHTNSTVTAAGTHEQWIWYDAIYVYLDNGKVTSWQTTN